MSECELEDSLHTQSGWRCCKSNIQFLEGTHRIEEEEQEKMQVHAPTFTENNKGGC
jgi:hypothetical protein